MTAKKGRNESVHNQSKLKLSKTVPDSQVQEVFDYWKLTMGKTRAVLDDKRRRDIGWAIAVYGMDGARDAIDGCKASDFHMGNNDRRTSYNDITLIFRDADHIERFQEQLDKSNRKSNRRKWIDS